MEYSRARFDKDDIVPCVVLRGRILPANRRREMHYSWLQPKSDRPLRSSPPNRVNRASGIPLARNFPGHRASAARVREATRRLATFCHWRSFELFLHLVGYKD